MAGELMVDGQEWELNIELRTSNVELEVRIADVHGYCAVVLDLWTAGKVNRPGATIAPATLRTENGARKGNVSQARRHENAQKDSDPQKLTKVTKGSEQEETE